MPASRLVVRSFLDASERKCSHCFRRGRSSAIKMLFEELQERLLVLVPSEAVLGVADLETVEMQLTEQAQAGVAAAS